MVTAIVFGEEFSSTNLLTPSIFVLEIQVVSSNKQRKGEEEKSSFYLHHKKVLFKTMSGYCG